MDETPGPPTKRHEYRNDIQALRGLAILVVVLFHAGFALPGGFVGVDVFFVISGFVITGVIERQLEATGRLRFADFYARRARRLLPVLALVTVVVLALSILILSPTGAQQNAAKTGAAASVFSSNLYLYRYGVNYFNPALLNPFLHTWSLGVEEQTYLILPATLAILWAIGRRFGRGRSTAVAGILGLTVISFALSAALTSGSTRFHVPLPVRFAFYSPVTRLWEFGFGILLALVAHRLPRRSGLGVVLGLIGLALVLYACFSFHESTPFPGTVALVPVLGAALMLAAGGMSDGWRKTSSSIGPMVWFGGLSYAWYLWHWPLIVFADVLWPKSTPVVWVAVGLSLLLAVVGRPLVENRFRYDRLLVGRRAIALAAVCIAVSLVVAAGVVAGGRRGWGNDELAQHVADAQRSRSEHDGCDSILRSTACVYPGGGAATVALVGDSHAAAISDMVMDATHARSADFDVWTRPGCPFLEGTVKRGDSECRIWSDKVLAWLQANPPDVLVVHAASGGYAKAGGLQGSDGRTAETTEESVALWTDGLAAIDRVLAPLGTQTIVIADVPPFSGSKVEFASLLHPNPAPRTRSRRAIEDEVAPMDAALAKLSASTGIVVIDPKPLLCARRSCSQYAGGWTYRDTNHLTPFGAHKLEGSLAAALDTATSSLP